MDNATPGSALRVRAVLALAKPFVTRALATLPQALTSGPFWFFVLAPFCMWIGYWLHIPDSAWTRNALASDLAMLLFVCTLLSAMWMTGALVLGRHRHAASVFLALSVITTIRMCLPQPTAANEPTEDVIPS